MDKKITKLLEKQSEIKNKLSKHEISFLDAELALRDIVNEFEKILHDNTLRHLSEVTFLNSIPCECGSKAKYKEIKDKTLNTGRTKIKICRRHYYCNNCRTNIYPMDKTYGLENVREFSPLMILIMSYLSTKDSYNEVSSTIKEILNINISSTAVQNQSEKLGKEVLDDMYSYIPSHSQRKCDRMILMADGGMIHTGKEVYKETRVGVVIKFIANEGVEVYKLAICESAEDFIRHFDRFCRLHGSLNCDDIAIIGDGAKWLDSLKNDCFPNARRIIDYYHAKEYLIAALKELYGKKWQEKEKSNELLGLLENGECLEIASELRKKAKNEDKDSAIYKAKRYYENHYDKMKYLEYEKKGYPIGSGEVEGAVRHIVHDRMGKSRSTWTIDDANAILILRAYKINDYWDRIKQIRYQKKIAS